LASKLTWRPVVLGAVGYLGIAFASPLALVAVPLAVFLLAQRPARRDVVVAVLLGIAAWVTLAGPADPFGALELAWLALLAGALAVVMSLRPGRPFVPAALAALGIAAAGAVVLTWATSLTWGEVAWRVSRHFGYQARLILGQMTAAADAAGGGAGSLVDTLERTVETGVRLASVVFPALLLLQSFAALALAWTLYQRLARAPVGAGLGRLRAFRFDDNLIWGVVLALIALLVPRIAGLATLGGNLAVFFGGLYVLRGLAVASALAATAGIDGLLAAAGATLVVLFLAPVAAMAALALGVTDTWVDWRRRLERAAGPR
jgi:hypothetical protein